MRPDKYSPRKPTRKVPFSCTLDPFVIEGIIKEASRLGIGRSELVNQLLTRILKSGVDLTSLPDLVSSSGQYRVGSLADSSLLP